MSERMLDGVIFKDEAVQVSRQVENADTHVININSEEEEWGVNVGLGDTEVSAIDDAINRLGDIVNSLRLERDSFPR